MNIVNKFFKRIIHKYKMYFCNDFSCSIKYLKKQKVVLPHPIGIVIGKGVELGQNCTIYQNVTIGSKTIEDSNNNRYPKLGDDVTLGANSIVIGNIRIGDNSFIGAGAVVISDIESNSMVVGNPARRIK